MTYPASAPAGSSAQIEADGQPAPVSAPVQTAQAPGIGVASHQQPMQMQTAPAQSMPMQHTQTAPSSLPPTAAQSRAATPAPMPMHITTLQAPTGNGAMAVQMTSMNGMPTQPHLGVPGQTASAPATPMPLPPQAIGTGIGVGYVNGNGQVPM